MPKKSGKVPTYCHHKASGQAVVRINGRDRYLGKFGSPESHRAYEARISEWRAGPLVHTQRSPDDGDRYPDLRVSELILAYWEHARDYYVKNGRPTDEQAGIRSALGYLRRLYGTIPVHSFGPLKLKAVRQAMIDADLSRRVINKYVQRIRRAFRWGVENELVDVTVHQSLLAVTGLRKGRTTARELPSVQPVLDAHIKAVLPYLTCVVQAMVKFQNLVGCRPEDVCGLKPRDIECEGDAWCCRPASHKMEHGGRGYCFFIGPKAQAIIKPFLGRDPDTFCFSPREAAEQQLAARRQQRQTPVTPSQAQRRRKRRPRRTPGEKYTRHSYNRAIRRACERAEIPPWSPNQLRHTAATKIRAEYGIEAARIILGHSSAVTSELYAEIDAEKAKEIMRKLG